MTKFGTAAFLGTLLVTTSALADDFGEEGTFAVSGERLTSIHHSSVKFEGDGDAEFTISHTNISLFAGPQSLRPSIDDDAGVENTAYTFPRIAADYFVIDGLSVGASLAYVHSSSSSETELMGTSVESDGPSTSGFLIAPRVGYAYMFQDNLGIWPKLGITYVSAGLTDDDDNEFSTSALAVSLDVPLVFVPVEHVAFTAGPSLDLGVSGSSEVNPDVGATEETDFKATDIGLNVGMTVFF